MNNPQFSSKRGSRWRVELGSGVVLFLLLVVLSSASTKVPIARAQDTDGYETEIHKGLDLLRRHRYEDALKSFKRANDLHEKKCAECSFGMAQAFEGLQAYRNVIESCDKTIELATNDKRLQAVAYNLKGIALQALASNKDQKKLQEAESAFRQALALGTDLPIVRYDLGITLMQQGRDAEGGAELKKYLELKPDDAKAEEARKFIENPRRAREAYAPDFSLTTSAGEYVSSDDLRGKVVLLDFWGTWCPPCVESVPSLRAMYKGYAKERTFMMISVSANDEEDKWRAFTAKNQMVWPQYFDRDNKIVRAFSVDRFPTYVLIDHEGIIRFRVSGLSFERGAALNRAIHKQIEIVAKTAPAE